MTNHGRAPVAETSDIFVGTIPTGHDHPLTDEAGRNLRFYHKLSVKFTNEKISFLVCRQFLLVKVEL